MSQVEVQRPVEFNFNLPLKTPEELRLFLKVAMGVEFPDTQVCPEHSTPWRAFCDAYFARDSIVVWEASRGFGGKSFMMAALGLCEALTLSADVNILGGSGDESKRVIEAMRRICAFPSFPRNWIHPKHGGEPAAGGMTTFVDGNMVTALMASQASVRGPHPQRLRMDEIDVMKIDLLDAAMGQTMELRGVKPQTLLSSTHQNPDGTMTEIKKRAKQMGYAFHPWCYKETVQPHGWLTKTEVKRKQREVTAEMFKVEYDLQEPSSEGRAIMTEMVEQMFRRDLGEYKGELRKYVQHQKPLAGAVYVHGADWAKTQDKTVVVTIRVDLPKALLVGFTQTHRRPWPEMIKILDDRIEEYTGGSAHDGTGMGGSMAGDLLRRDSKGFDLKGQLRSELITDYIAAIENGEIEAPMIDYMYAEHKYVTNDDLFGTGHMPDTFSAMIVAWRLAKVWRAMHHIPEGIEQAGSYWLRTQLQDGDDDDSD